MRQTTKTNDKLEQQHQQQHLNLQAYSPAMADPWSWLESLPPVTRVWFCASAAVNVGVSLDFLDPEDLYFDEARIYSKLELWRVLTPFLYGGGALPDLHVLLSLYMITIHSTAYEKNPAHSGGSPQADYAFCLIFCITFILLTYSLLNHLYEYFHYGDQQRYLYPLFSRTLITSIMYLWTRRNPNANIQFIMIPLQGRYLAFADLAVQLAMQNPVSELIHGMLVGHIFYFVIDIVPTLIGRHVLATPAILTDIMNDILGVQEEFRGGVLRQPQPRGEGRPPQQQAGWPRVLTTLNDQERRTYEEEGAADAHIAAKMGHLGALRQLAQSSDQGRRSLGAKDRNDWQPLHEAVRGGYTGIVDFLLGFEDVVDKNARTMRGKGPNALFMAEEFHGLDHPVTKRLQEAGAIRLGPEE